MLQSHFRLLDPSDIGQLQKNPISVMGRILKPSFLSIPLRRSNLSESFPAQLNDRLVKTITEWQRQENDEGQRQMQHKEDARNAGAGGDRDSPGIYLDITQVSCYRYLSSSQALSTASNLLSTTYFGAIINYPSLNTVTFFFL